MGQFIHKGFNSEHINGEPYRSPKPHGYGKVHHYIVYKLVRDRIGHIPDARNGIRTNAVLHHLGRLILDQTDGAATLCDQPTSLPSLSNPAFIRH